MKLGVYGRHCSLYLAALLMVACVGPGQEVSPRWVASWAASPQPVWKPGFMLPANVPALLRDSTVRQALRLSLGGQRLRIRLSNAYGTQPLAVGGASVALSDGRPHPITFSGQASARIPPGALLVSDPVDLVAASLAQLSVSLYLPEQTPLTTFHWEGRQTSYLLPGNQAMVLGNRPKVLAVTTTARLLLTGVEVETFSSGGAIAVLGDSITDGAGTSLNQNRRWPDLLAERLAPQGVAVINAGISGNQLLANTLGSNALARLDRDVLSQPGVRTVIVQLGINDIGFPGTPLAPDARAVTATALIAAYKQLSERVRSLGMQVVGVTLPPFQNAMAGTPMAAFYSPAKDSTRHKVNAWVRRTTCFDAVLDFDRLLQDRRNAARLAAAYDSGDHLHPGDAGHRALAAGIGIGR